MEAVDPPELEPPELDPPELAPPVREPPVGEPPDPEPPEPDPPELEPPELDPPELAPTKLDPPEPDPPEPPGAAPPALDPPDLAPPELDPPALDPPEPPRKDPPALAPPDPAPSEPDPPVLDPPEPAPPKLAPPELAPPELDPPELIPVMPALELDPPELDREPPKSDAPPELPEDPTLASGLKLVSPLELLHAAKASSKEGTIRMEPKGATDDAAFMVLLGVRTGEDKSRIHEVWGLQPCRMGRILFRRSLSSTGSRRESEFVPPTGGVGSKQLLPLSRKILAWTVGARLEPTATCQVLLAAGKHLASAGRPLLYADSGVENVNGAVDATLLSACLDRVLAQVDVGFSNSMIEAFWRSLKHQWLYLNSPTARRASRSGGYSSCLSDCS